jgi:hypothetical protein
MRHIVADLRTSYDVPVSDDKHAVRAMLRGYRAVERRQLELRAQEGPRPRQAVAESLSALNAAQDMGLWPGPRSAVDQSETEIERVRDRWARVQNRAKKAAQR